MPTTETNLFMLTGMIDLKNKINAVAAKVLPLGTMNHEKFASFKNTSVQGGGAKDLDELYEQAKGAAEFPEVHEGDRRRVGEGPRCSAKGRGRACGR